MTPRSILFLQPRRQGCHFNLARLADEVAKEVPGFNRRILADVEHGRVLPTPEALEVLARILGVSPPEALLRPVSVDAPLVAEVPVTAAS